MNDFSKFQQRQQRALQIILLPADTSLMQKFQVREEVLHQEFHQSTSHFLFKQGHCIPYQLLWPTLIVCNLSLNVYGSISSLCFNLKVIECRTRCV